MLGLRPRLRARHSLFDLIGRKHIDQLSSSSASTLPLEEDIDDLSPLPTSPPSTVSLSTPPSEIPVEALAPVIMAPVRTRRTTLQSIASAADLASRKIPSGPERKLEKINMVRTQH